MQTASAPTFSLCSNETLTRGSTTEDATRSQEMSQINSPSLSHANLPMVSHAEVSAPAASRRASSVASQSRSRSRQHHRGQSHHGGSSYRPQNEFPFFAQTGDVEIVIACDGQEKRYLLHRLILAQFSGFFEAGMSDEWSRTHAVTAPPPRRPEQALTVIGETESQVSQARPMLAPEQTQPIPGRRRWRYELDWTSLEDDDEPILVQKPPSPGGMFTSSFQPTTPAPRPRPTASHGSFFRSMANLTLSNPPPPPQQQPPDPATLNPLIRDYDNLFRTFYSYEPILNTTNIASAYSECKALLSLADMYDALEVVGPRIDHHLLRFSSRLFKQIAKYPPSYLKLGYLARSRIIFSEALTHVVGQWPAAYPYLKTAGAEQGQGQSGGGYEVPQAVIDLIEDKVDELEELKSRVEAKLFRLTLTTPRGERVNPSNDYLGWLAMSLFRQWVAENTTPEVRGILKTPAVGGRPGSGNVNTQQQIPQNSIHQPLQPQPPPPPLTPSRIYRLLASPNPSSYLPHDELKRFLKLHPSSTPPSTTSRTPSYSSASSQSFYSKENMKRFERKVDEIKNLARDTVKPLTRNVLELDLRLLSDGGGGGLGYLTCMRVEEGEIPWD